MQRWLDPNISPANPQTLLALLRHGKTLWNEEGRIQGLKDSPLSPDGRQQVKEWAEFLGTYSIDEIICSDLGRAKETAAIILQQLGDIPIQWNPLLREQHWGEWEGKTFAYLHKHHDEELQTQIRAGWDFRPPGGESRREVLQRVLPALQAIAQQHSGRQILCICHEGIIKTVLYHLAGRAFLPDEKKILKKRDLHLLQVKDTELSIAALNIMTTLKKNKTSPTTQL